MSFQTQLDQERAIQAAHLELEKKKVIAQVYQKYQQLLRCDANAGLIIEVIERFAGDEAVPSLDLFQTALDLNPDEMKSFAIQPIERTREQIVEEYLRLLAAHSRQDAYSLKSEEARLRHLPIEALRQRLSDLKVRQKMASQSVSTVKAIVADAHADKSAFPGWPTLPSRLVPQGSIQSVEVNADYLNGLAKTDIWLFKRFVRLYGSEQIDARRGIK